MHTLHVCSQCATVADLQRFCGVALNGKARRGVSNDTAGGSALRTTESLLQFFRVKVDRNKAGNRKVGGIRLKKNPTRLLWSGPLMTDPLRDQMVLAKATAVSDIRLEKPHSLSYQDKTRTNVPSMTLVWSFAKIEEWLSWLKSRETNGSSV